MVRRCLSTVLLSGCLAGCNAKVSTDTPAPAPDDTAPQQREKEDAMTSSESVDVEAQVRYAGYVRLAHFDPAEVLEREALVVRDRGELEAFIERIPKTRLQKRQPAPPSEDPLLEHPEIDFDRHCMIVLIRGDTPWGGIEVQEMQRDGDRLRIRREHPPLPEGGPMAQPLGIGAYVALVVDRFEGPLVVDEVE
jgi:hypothetical protein